MKAGLSHDQKTSVALVAVECRKEDPLAGDVLRPAHAEGVLPVGRGFCPHQRLYGVEVGTESPCRSRLADIPNPLRRLNTIQDSLA